MRYCFNISDTFKKTLGFVWLMIFSFGITSPVVGQQSPDSTGFVWRNLEVRPLNCTFSPDGTQLACGSWGRGPAENITIVDAKSGDIVRSFGKKEFGNRQVELMAWSNDGTKLAAVTNYMPQSESGLRGVVYEVSSGKIIRPLDLKGASRLADVAFSENGKRVAAVAIPEVYHWSVTEKGSADITTLEMKNYGGESVKFLPGAEQLVTGRKDAFIWDATTGKQIRTLQNNSPEGNARFTDFAFSPDGKFIAATTSNLRTVVWNRETGKQYAEFGLGSEIATKNQKQPSLTFISPDLLSWYIPSAEKVQVTQIPSGKSVLIIDAPKVSSRTPGMAWAGDHFVFANLQRQPLTMQTLCRRTADCGKEEGITPEKVAELLPTSVAGLERAAITSRWGEKGPIAQAMYGNMKRGLEMEVNITSKAEVQKMHQQWKSRLQQEGMFKKMHNGHTIYGGGDEKSRGMVLLLENAAVMMEGNVAMEQMMSIFDAMPLGKIQELAASNE